MRLRGTFPRLPTFGRRPSYRGICCSRPPRAVRMRRFPVLKRGCSYSRIRGRRLDVGGPQPDLHFLYLTARGLARCPASDSLLASPGKSHPAPDLKLATALFRHTVGCPPRIRVPLARLSRLCAAIVTWLWARIGFAQCPTKSPRRSALSARTDEVPSFGYASRRVRREGPPIASP